MKDQRLPKIFGAQRVSPTHHPVVAVPFQVLSFILGERPYLVLVYGEGHTISTMERRRSRSWGEDSRWAWGGPEPEIWAWFRVRVEVRPQSVAALELGKQCGLFILYLNSESHGRVL